MNRINIMKKLTLILCLSGYSVIAFAQQVIHYDLVQLLRENKLETIPQQQTRVLAQPGRQAISTKGTIVWLKDVNFKEGTIEIDLRGKDVFLQSFLGIAFHGTDTTMYDAVYFRPFNFRHADTLRRKWSVQYMSLPDHNYDVLRKEHPLVYENAVNPVPKADEWFHATITVKNGWIIVYVNHSLKESLKVKLLNNKNDGKIGLWNDGLTGDFANLTSKSN
jgi:hypothetical protein